MKKRIVETKYCKKHNQIYYAYLIECPICVGERRGEEIKKKQKAGTYNIN